MNTNISLERKTHKSNLLKNILQYKYMYLMLLPGLLFFVIFKYVPMYGLQLAFKTFKANLGIMGSPWVGIEHFQNLIFEKSFLVAFKNTLIISVLKIAIGFPVPIILTLLMNELRSTRYKKTLQTIYTFPHFLSWVILAGISINLFSNVGAVNNLLTSVGLDKINVLTDKNSFRYFIAYSGVWKEAGWSTILYLAAITNIDLSIYEAATVDGANRFQKMMNITLPGISDMMIITLILSFGHIMDAGFEQIFNLYNASVYDVADIIDTYVYRISFQQSPNFGFSTAVGLFKGITNFILLISVNKIVKAFGNSGVI